MTKNELRQIFSDKRKLWSRTDLELASQKIANLFFANIQVPKNGTLHVFLPIRKLNEINTFYIINPLKKSESIRIIFPKILSGTNQMEHILLDKTTCLEENPWGIPEPRDGIRVGPENIDVVLLPLLAFDLNGFRLGYGKGFYDRFLMECKKDCQFIGLSLEEPTKEYLPRDQWDIPMHVCITPSKIYRFR